ncbi:hypothetical protein GS501_04545 [Saccharibacter sp. 17.LH.SD]|uniref:hypothetical protein n=1 Tax=Saccharibacter sp. 17.LH.SD TaxID=2689393 RepID=UPI0013719811|nr:hypothetical protein [Saccharibacter sp. 17.LH.SD]MXV44314.1 hypothetical protein [Saccharibacter sp. 17.LH.SD]
MRYYDLRIWRPKSQDEIKKINRTHKFEGSQPTNGGSLAIGTGNLLHLSSYLIHDKLNQTYSPGGMPQTGVFDPGALDIDFQISVIDYASPIGGAEGASITIRGIDPATIGQASSLQGATLRLSAGMGHGYPLAKPEQAGVVLYGQIWSPVGNWEGEDLSLTLFVLPYNGHATTSENTKPNQPPKVPTYTYQCKRGASLKEAIKASIRQVSPNVEVIFQTANDPVATGDIQGVYHTDHGLFEALADSWEIATNKQSRITITPRDGKFFCKEPHPDQQAIPIAIEELIGQPTWNNVASITICCPLRADISVGDIITLPDEAGAIGAIHPQSALSFSPPKKRASLFSGKFTVLHVNHLGQFRSADGQQWMTAIDCYPTVS